jgi:hypothetical protein
MIAMDLRFRSRAVQLVTTLVLCFAAQPAAYAEPACRTGGKALADAFVLANPLSAYFFGSLEAYVANNTHHFRAGGDAIRCANALARAFLGSAVQLYDPSDLRRQQELNARLGSMGISPGPQQPTASNQLYGISMQLSRLARVLPPAAAGDYGPLYTPTNELEQMQLAAAQVFQILLQDPSMASIFAQIEPIVREGANLEHRIISEAAARLASIQ